MIEQMDQTVWLCTCTHNAICGGCKEARRRADEAHRGDPDFLKALDDLRQMHLSKGSDYADLTDPLRNYVRSSEDCGVEPWRGALLRLAEKYHRITNLLAKDATPNYESIEDTLMDLAALALIVRSLRRRGQSADATGEP